MFGEEPQYLRQCPRGGRSEGFEYFTDEPEISVCVHGPAMLRQVLRVLDIGEPEALGMAPDERRDVLALRPESRLARGRLERFDREHLRVEPVGIGRRMYVADIVHAGTPGGVLGKHAARDRRIQERAVGGDPHDGFGIRLAGRKAKPVEHVPAAANAAKPRARAPIAPPGSPWSPARPRDARSPRRARPWAAWAPGRRAPCRRRVV